ncbi:MAG: XRE family transcriptional regulator, partial [Clostridia bacterium]|nr:XRE family transcriptional regulator [Clostridia bacterium]
MRYAYDSDYLPLAQRVLGDMYDFAVNTLQYTLKEFHMMFLVCGMSQQFEIGNPTFIAGKNGCEIAKIVVYDCYGNVPEEEDEMYVDKSPE